MSGQQTRAAATVHLRRDAGRLGPTTGPWIRTRQISKVAGPIHADVLARVVDRRDAVLGWGLYSEASNIAVRMVAWSEDAPGPDWLPERIRSAVAARSAYDFGRHGTTGYRLVNSEGDGLPGLVADRFDTDLVVQITTAPMLAMRPAIVEALREAVGSARIHVVVPEGAAKHENIPAAVDLDGQPGSLSFRERDLGFSVDPPPAQKTGAYFDQRDNRRWVATLAAAHGGPMLDVGCHVGGFALAAAAAGVPATGVDSSVRALARAQANASAAGFDRVGFVQADMFGALDDAALRGPFGTIVVDPPKLAVRRSDVDRARGAMQRTVGRLAPRLAVGGHLVLCSCSHHLGLEQLDRVLLGLPAASPFTRVKVQGPDVDHPVAPGHREGSYLVVAAYQRRA